MNQIEKFIDIIRSWLDGKKLNNFDISKEELIEYRNLLDEFSFIYSHSNDNAFYKSDKVAKAFNENILFVDSYFQDSDRFRSLETEVKKVLETDKRVLTTFITNEELSRELITIGSYYEIENDIVNVYEYAKANSEQCFIYPFKDCVKFLVPYEVSSEKMDDMISKGEAKVDNGIYKIAPTSPIIQVLEMNYKKSLEVGEELANLAFPYVENEGEFISDLIQYIDESKEMMKIKNNLIGAYIIDEFGNKLNYDELKLDQIIKKMRDALSHGNVEEYVINLGQNNYYGKIFILKSKTGAEHKFKCALICTHPFVKFLSYNNSIAYKNDGNIYKFLVVPFASSRLFNSEQTQKLMESSLILTVALNDEVNECVLCNYINEISYRYSIIKDIPSKNSKVVKTIRPDALEYFSKKIKEKFSEANVTLDNLPNIDLINSRVLNNDRFYKQQSKEKNEQEKFISSIINDYYGAEVLMDDYKEKKQQRVQLKNLGIQNMAINLENVLIRIYKKDANLKSNYGFYTAEYELFLTLIIAYIYLVKNNITEDIDRNIKNPHLNAMIKGSDNKNLEEKIADINMSCFSFYDANGDQRKRIPQLSKEKHNVLKWIKNAICHNGIYFKQPFAKDVKDQIIIFESEGENYKSSKQKTLKHIVEIKNEDFQKFCQQPLFKEYKTDIHQKIEVKTFDQLIKCATNLLSNKLD